jgi:hypothetical protein
MEAARILSIDESYSIDLRMKLGELIYEINDQQSDQLKVIE